LSLDSNAYSVPFGIYVNCAGRLYTLFGDTYGAMSSAAVLIFTAADALSNVSDATAIAANVIALFILLF
jgi:hypothetical protein